jgi:hypothetical protein
LYQDNITVKLFKEKARFIREGTPEQSEENRKRKSEKISRKILWGDEKGQKPNSE